MKERTVLIALVITLVLGVAATATCGQITWHGPRQSPEELAAVLRACTTCQANTDAWPAPLPGGPSVVVVGQPGALGWLDFPPPTPALRLDGSPAWWPPAAYRIGYQGWSTVLRHGVSESSTHGPAKGPRNRRN
jgi:hypothetical protein